MGATRGQQTPALGTGTRNNTHLETLGFNSSLRAGRKGSQASFLCEVGRLNPDQGSDFSVSLSVH